MRMAFLFIPFFITILSIFSFLHKFIHFILLKSRFIPFATHNG